MQHLTLGEMRETSVIASLAGHSCREVKVPWLIEVWWYIGIWWCGSYRQLPVVLILASFTRMKPKRQGRNFEQRCVLQFGIYQADQLAAREWHHAHLGLGHHSFILELRDDENDFKKWAHVNWKCGQKRDAAQAAFEAGNDTELKQLLHNIVEHV